MKEFKDEYIDSYAETVEWSRNGRVRIKLSRNVFVSIV